MEHLAKKLCHDKAFGQRQNYSIVILSFLCSGLSSSDRQGNMSREKLCFGEYRASNRFDVVWVGGQYSAG